MKNQVKNSIAIGTTGAILTASAISGVAISDLRVKELERMALYEQVKSELSVKYLQDVPFTINEFRMFTQILNEEGRKGKFKNISIVRGEPLTKTLIKQMYEK